MKEHRTYIVEDEVEKIGFGNVLVKVKKLLGKSSLLIVKDWFIGHRDKLMLIKKMGYRLIHLRKLDNNKYEYMLVLSDNEEQ